MKLQNALTFTPDGVFQKSDIAIADGRFSSPSDIPADIDAEGLYAIPGLIDIHFHGCMGYDFCDGTKEALDAISAYQAEQGVTAICPATMTYPEDKLAGICKNAAGYQNPEGAHLVGINMEGPFLSLAKKGAQNPAYLHAPDIEMFRRLQAQSGGLIKLLDVAPEEPGAMELIDALHKEVSISLAHTTADYDTALAAYKRGARHTTHLYNAMPPYTHRAPGVVGAAMDSPGVYAELIADGVHVHPSVVRATFKMFGEDRIVLISDSMMATGLPDGAYSLGGQAVTVTGNLATLADGTIAGSATNLMDCVRTAVRKMGIPLETAVKAATINAAEAIGVSDMYGSIAPGKSADLVLLDRELRLKLVILSGKIIVNHLS